jgi:acetolactate synthase small subunit
VKHTLSVLVEDKPGALARISTMFARRGFNIDSLAVGPTERAGVSCITLRVDCSQHSLEQIEKQIHKLVNVLRVTELVAGEAVERELLLLKVAADQGSRAELIASAGAFRGQRSSTPSRSSPGPTASRSSSGRGAWACPAPPRAARAVGWRRSTRRRRGILAHTARVDPTSPERNP